MQFAIVLKANETRLNDTFKYTLSEILKRLDKNAINNVIFIFSNSASTNFKISKTQAILQTFLSESNLQIPLPPEKPTIYCFENDTVQYLAERKNDVEPEEDEEDTSKGWRKSAESSAQMIHYVCSLDPLPLQGINAIYDAEWTISILSKLVLETLTCVFKDTKKLEQKQRDADVMKLKVSLDPAAFVQHNLRNLRMFLHDITESKVIHVPLGHTNVVCEGSRCVEEVNGEIEYLQICCEACKSPWMFFCQSISLSGKCKRCGCDKSTHEWRTTKTEIVAEPTEDGNLEVVDSSNAVGVIDRAISAYEDRVNQCRDEAKQMLRTCAHMNTFVRKTALLQRSGDDDDMTRILKNKMEVFERYKKTKIEFLEELRRIDNQYNKFLVENVNYKPNDVHEQIQKLYRLPVKGNDLRRAMEVEEKARDEAGKRPSRIWNLPECAWRVFSKIKSSFW